MHIIWLFNPLCLPNLTQTTSVSKYLSFSIFEIPAFESSRLSQKKRKVMTYFYMLWNKIFGFVIAEEVSNLDFSNQDSYPYTPLDSSKRQWIVAASKNDEQTLKRLMTNNPEIVRTRDPTTGYTALHWAALTFSF